jgi:ATP-dependent exoDNAse (exonuclease V) alpha subunit
MIVNLKGFGIKEIDYDSYNYFNYGYAMTIHKSQGQTVDNVIYSADKNANSNLFYVAISRGSEKASIYISPLDKEKFIERIEQSQIKPDILEIKNPGCQAG